MFKSTSATRNTIGSATVADRRSPIESMTCACGNTAAEEGLMTCDSNGMIACLCEDQRHAHEALIHLVPWPQKLADRYTLCASCGRVYSNKNMSKGCYDAALVVNLDERDRKWNMHDHHEIDKI